MGAPRAAALLIGVGLLGLSAGSAPAGEPSVAVAEPEAVSADASNAPRPEASEAAEIRPDAQPGVEADAPPRAEAKETESTILIEGIAPPEPSAAAPDAQETTAAPNVVAPDAQNAATAAPDIPPPDLPSVAVSIPTPDPVARAIESLVTNGTQIHPRLGPKEREAVVTFYALGGFKPIWTKDRAWTDRARSAIARLRMADQDALDPAAYPVPALSAANGDAPERLAEADLKLSVSAVLYARDARGARIEPWRLSKLITPKLDLPAGDAVLTALAAAGDPGAALQAFNPPHAGYQALRRKLAEVRAARAGAPAALP